MNKILKFIKKKDLKKQNNLKKINNQYKNFAFSKTMFCSKGKKIRIYTLKKTRNYIINNIKIILLTKKIKKTLPKIIIYNLIRIKKYCKIKKYIVCSIEQINDFIKFFSLYKNNLQQNLKQINKKNKKRFFIIKLLINFFQIKKIKKILFQINFIIKFFKKI